MNEKPQLSFWQIWNMCFGFLGIQFGFALQNANVSRIFESLGADIEQIPLLWIAAPVTGLIVQPIIGYMSDNTWGRLGRRRPFFLIGAVLASISLIFMPNSPTLWIAAGMLWVLDASINISMEPFRAFVGDNLNEKQRPLGYAMQSLFIGIGAVVASALPWIMTNWFEVSNEAPMGEIADSVKYAFYWGALVLLVAVCWTTFTSKEYSPEELASFDKHSQSTQGSNKLDVAKFGMPSISFLAIGVVFTAAIYLAGWEKQLYILSIGLVVTGLCFFLAKSFIQNDKHENGFAIVMHDLLNMPGTMKQLAVVQFFSWFALFAMWIYTNSAVTRFHFGSVEANDTAFNQGSDWVGVLFAAYNGFAAIAAIFIPKMVSMFGIRMAHTINLGLGAIGFLSFTLITDPDLLLVSMVGVGFAWASILSLPYSMLSNSLPSHKMGVFMGIFNFFIVIPQILAASLLGLVLNLFNADPIHAFYIAAVSFAIAGGFTLKTRIQAA
ncbi:MFS transporter [Paraglaciecola aquimarina]|uniref:MFS transporter n=1 Tax=Paraglaciecola algarum TaxID=3050085 RepID=A0ABS9DC02_9ALTE|nr:MFS transporter [Paraglaciecola sp. G1-23]MCF2949860.1 MFS transporter [Paraglaciecola sp. G1-23]